MRGLHTFVENNPEPYNFMDWALLRCEVNRERVVSCQNNIGISNDSGYSLALVPVIFYGFDGAVQMSGDGELDLNKS